MSERIDSPKNPRLKAAARLRERRARKQTALILVDGARETARALDGGVEIVEAFVSPTHADNSETASTVRALTDRGVPVLDTSETAFAKLRFGDRDDGIVAVARRPRDDLESLTWPADPLIVVIEGVEKPGNLGALLRTADAVGAHAVIAADARGDIYGPNAIRASLGAIFTVTVVEATSAAALERLRADGIRIVTATPAAETSYLDVSYAGPTAFVFGAEATGVSNAWLAADCQPVRIPMCGRVDSMNVSATAAVLLFEAQRQRLAGAEPVVSADDDRK